MPENGARILIVHPAAEIRGGLATTLRQVAGGSAMIHEAGSPTEGLRAARWQDPRLVFLDLGEERKLALEVARELRAVERLIVGIYNPLLLREGQDEFFRSAARAGVGDFVPLPASAAELGEVLAAAPRAAPPAAPGRTLAFFSHKGGVGTSTLAVNTALVLAGSGQAGEVALVDAALQFGDAAALLGLAPDRDLADMARELDGPGALSTYLVRHEATGLRVLARPRDLAAAEAIAPEEMSRMLIRLEQRFDVVVVDTPPVLDLMTLAVLDVADKVFVVTAATVPAVMGTARLLRILAEQGVGAERLRVVVNGYGGGDGELGAGTIAERLGRPVDHTVEREGSALAAASRGEPLVLRRQRGGLKSTFATVMGQIADDAVRPVRAAFDAAGVGGSLLSRA